MTFKRTNVEVTFNEEERKILLSAIDIFHKICVECKDCDECPMNYFCGCSGYTSTSDSFAEELENFVSSRT